MSNVAPPARLTAEDALRISGAWIIGDVVYQSLDDALEYAEGHERIYPCVPPFRPSPADLASDIVAWICDASCSDTHWEWAAVINQHGEPDDCVLDGDPSFMTVLEAACSIALRSHHGHPRGPKYTGRHYVLASDLLYMEAE